MVYKTRGDYYNYVPIFSLSEDKTKVSVYSEPKDICRCGCPRPVRLHQGYLTPYKIGVPNTAFLNLTYEEYENQNKLPYELVPEGVLYADPFLELYD